MVKVFLIGVGGFLGAISRFSLSHLVGAVFAHPFPAATLAINFLGSVGIGVLFEAFKNHHWLPTLSHFIGIGFLGSFTTFSTFSFETVDLIKRTEYQLASMNVVASVLLCVAGVIFGEWLGRYFRI